MPHCKSLNPPNFTHCCWSLWQAIGKAEEEGTRKVVEAKTARAQAEKLQKECGKIEKEKVKAQGEVEKLMASIQVSIQRRRLVCR
jgi:hypothetical protein